MSRRDIKQSLTGTLVFGGRGLDSIEKVIYYSNKDKYSLQIESKHGSGGVADLVMKENMLKFYGNTRVPPFAKLELSGNAAKKLEKSIKSEFEIEEKEL